MPATRRKPNAANVLGPIGKRITGHVAAGANLGGVMPNTVADSPRFWTRVGRRMRGQPAVRPPARAPGPLQGVSYRLGANLAAEAEARAAAAAAEAARQARATGLKAIVDKGRGIYRGDRKKVLVAGKDRVKKTAELKKVGRMALWMDVRRDAANPANRARLIASQVARFSDWLQPRGWRMQNTPRAAPGEARIPAYAGAQPRPMAVSAERQQAFAERMAALINRQAMRARLAPEKERGKDTISKDRPADKATPPRWQPDAAGRLPGWTPVTADEVKKAMETHFRVPFEHKVVPGRFTDPEKKALDVVAQAAQKFNKDRSGYRTVDEPGFKQDGSKETRRKPALRWQEFERLVGEVAAAAPGLEPWQVDWAARQYFGIYRRGMKPAPPAGPPRP